MNFTETKRKHPFPCCTDARRTDTAVSTTAYGALVRVPGDVDLLIAGTSCVDYSNLNNEKQGIEANGESGRTFHGMMSWVRNHRPPLIILENICNAPWDDIVTYFKGKEYSADWIQLDTKSYYIPHTRNRKYLLAVDKAHSAIPGSWKAKIRKLERPASSTLDAFLLPTDDPRIHQARQKLASKANDAEGRARGRTDWGRCESRHQRARLEEQLGTKRPLTSWEEGEIVFFFNTGAISILSCLPRTSDLRSILSSAVNAQLTNSGGRSCAPGRCSARILTSTCYK